MERIKLFFSENAKKPVFWTVLVGVLVVGFIIYKKVKGSKTRKR